MGNFSFSINQLITCNVVDIWDAFDYSVKSLLEDISCHFWLQMIVIAIWICPMGCWMLSLGFLLCPAWHANSQTWYLAGWRVRILACLVECHQLSCCTTSSETSGFTWCFCWDPLDPGITSGNHLVSSQEQLSWPIQCTLWPLW